MSFCVDCFPFLWNSSSGTIFVLYCFGEIRNHIYFLRTYPFSICGHHSWSSSNPYSSWQKWLCFGGKTECRRKIHKVWILLDSIQMKDIYSTSGSFTSSKRRVKRNYPKKSMSALLEDPKRKKCERNIHKWIRIDIIMFHQPYIHR